MGGGKSFWYFILWQFWSLFLVHYSFINSLFFSLSLSPALFYVWSLPASWIRKVFLHYNPELFHSPPSWLFVGIIVFMFILTSFWHYIDKFIVRFVLKKTGMMFLSFLWFVLYEKGFKHYLIYRFDMFFLYWIIHEFILSSSFSFFFLFFRVGHFLLYYLNPFASVNFTTNLTSQTKYFFLFIFENFFFSKSSLLFLNISFLFVNISLYIFVSKQMKCFLNSYLNN